MKKEERRAGRHNHRLSLLFFFFPCPRASAQPVYIMSSMSPEISIWLPSRGFPIGPLKPAGPPFLDAARFPNRLFLHCPLSAPH